MAIARIQSLLVALALLGGAGDAAAQGGGAPGPAGAELCQIRITTDPDGASVTCSGTTYDASPTTIVGLPPGRHLLEIRKEGYHPRKRTVELSPGQRTAEDFRLKPVTGLVLVHTDPQGADVEIDEAHRGQTPLLLTDVALGTHRLVLTARGYKPREVEFQVHDRKPTKIDEALTSDSARIALTSEPPGANVRLGGVDKGTTPLRIDRVLSGEIVLELRHPGFENYVQKLVVRAGEDLPIHARLTPLPGSLTIVSIPEEARVYIDDQFRGVTPYTIPNAMPQAYDVRLEAVGYRPMTRTIRLTQAQDLTEEFRLERDSGMLELITEPAGVTVFVDGKQVGVTEPGETDQVSEPFTVDLLAVGEHVLQLTKKGHFEVRRDFEIRNDETFTLHQKLKRRFIPDTIVETRAMPEDEYRGVVSKRLPSGDIELEIYDGVFKTIPFLNILRVIPLNTETPRQE